MTCNLKISFHLDKKTKEICWFQLYGANSHYLITLNSFCVTIGQSDSPMNNMNCDRLAFDWCNQMKLKFQGRMSLPDNNFIVPIHIARLFSQDRLFSFMGHGWNNFHHNCCCLNITNCYFSATICSVRQYHHKIYFKSQKLKFTKWSKLFWLNTRQWKRKLVVYAHVDCISLTRNLQMNWKNEKTSSLR